MGIKHNKTFILYILLIISVAIANIVKIIASLYNYDWLNNISNIMVLSTSVVAVFFVLGIFTRYFFNYIEPKNKENYSELLDKLRNQGVNNNIQTEYIITKSLYRIDFLISNQEKKANINLFIGIIVAFLGVLFIIMNVLDYPKNELNLYQLVLYILPRLSIILIIETFAYFFLRLYRLSLDEIKYLHNEATSIEHRLLALKVALEKNDEETIKEIILALSKFEKNSIEQTVVQENTPVSLEYLVKLADVLNKK